MSENEDGRVDGRVERADDSPEAKYESPRLIPLGNARELLAGTTGTQTDALTHQPNAFH
jgi:hypothetical protein